MSSACLHQREILAPPHKSSWLFSSQVTPETQLLLLEEDGNSSRCPCQALKPSQVQSKNSQFCFMSPLTPQLSALARPYLKTWAQVCVESRKWAILGIEVPG